MKLSEIRKICEVFNKSVNHPGTVSDSELEVAHYFARRAMPKMQRALDRMLTEEGYGHRIDVHDVLTQEGIEVYK